MDNNVETSELVDILGVTFTIDELETIALMTIHASTYGRNNDYANVLSSATAYRIYLMFQSGKAEEKRILELVSRIGILIEDIKNKNKE
jgi:hypothetical protein